MGELGLVCIADSAAAVVRTEILEPCRLPALSSWTTQNG